MTVQRITILFFSCIALMAAAPVFAGGSAYSMFGIGELSFSPSSRSLGMGAMSSALWSTSSILSQNPASWSTIKTAELQGAFGYENIASQSATDNAFYGTSGIRAATIAIPIAPKYGMTLAMGFSPLSTVAYALNYDPQTLEDTNSFVGNYSGTGGVSQFFFGSSVVPVSWLSLGAAIEYNFGSFTRTADVLFNATSQYNHTLISTRISPDGFDGRLAAMVTYGGFTAGVNVRLPANLRMVEKQEYASTTFGATDTIPSWEYHQTLPLAINGGVSFHVADYLFGMEFGTENWSASTVDGVHPAELQSSTLIGFGIERTGAPVGSWFDKWALRFGGMYRTSYVIVNNNSINEAYVTLGVGLPINPQSLVDVALQYGSRGTTTNGLIRENVFNLNMSFTINEVWFQSREAMP